jgi:hypothetical protein
MRSFVSHQRQCTRAATLGAALLECAMVDLASSLSPHLDIIQRIS